jgi:hypothetical protein
VIFPQLQDYPLSNGTATHQSWCICTHAFF